MTCHLCSKYWANTAFENISREINECVALLKSQTECSLRVSTASGNLHYTETN